MSEHTTSSPIPRAARPPASRTRAESGLVGLLGGGAAGILLAEMVAAFLTSLFGETRPTVLFVALPVICAVLCAVGAASLPYHRTGGR
jgi:hypothetical protein